MRDAAGLGVKGGPRKRGAQEELTSPPLFTISYIIGLAKKFIWVFPYGVLKNPNDFSFFQSNTYFTHLLNELLA